MSKTTWRINLFQPVIDGRIHIERKVTLLNGESVIERKYIKKNKLDLYINKTETTQ